MRYKNTYFSFIFITLLPMYVNAQTEKVSEAILFLGKIWDNHYEISDTTIKNLSVTDAFQLIQSDIKPVSSEEELQNRIKRAEIENYRHDPGLDVSANYLENFNPGLGEDDDNLIYNRRIQAGINWQILNNGWIENRMLAQKAENELFFARQSETVKTDKQSYTDQWNRIIYLFNTEKIKWLDKRKQILNDLEKTCSDLYLLKFITREKYLGILSNKTEVESMYRIYSDYNLAFDKLNDSILQKVERFPVFDIRYDSLIRILDGKKKGNDSASVLFTENLKLEKSLARDINLSTSLRYNYYNLVTENPPSRNFLTFGVNFSMPLPFNYKQKKELAEARSEYAKYIFENAGEEFHREVLNDCYEFRYKLKQYESFCQKRNLLEEKLRKYNALKDIQDLDFNPVEALQVMDEYISVQIEMIDLTQNLYLKFLRISSYFSSEMEPAFTESFYSPSGYELDDAISRSVYIWSSAFDKHSDVFIREYLVYNKFDRIIISTQQDTSYQSKLNKWLPDFTRRKMDVEIMIGDNSIINQSDYTAAIDSKLKNLDFSQITALHLDIEPHTFPDWKENEAKYISNYLDLLQKARIYCDSRSIELAVSIPLHYPETAVKEIFSICDRVYFMAYENTKADYIQRKTDVYKEFREKWVISQSVKDFSNRPALEQQLMDLYKATGCTRFAVHDFTRLAELDELNIEEKK